jgi:Calcium binding
MKSSNWAIGESVVVKPGVTDPDTGRDIGGWQGRISAMLDGAEILTIRWDSLTLRSMPPALLAWSEEEGLSWSEMNLSPEEVGSAAAARDSEDDVAAVIAELESQTSWLYLGGEQGKRIQALVNRAAGHNELAVFRAWHAYLEEHLVFPFAATVVEYQRGPVRQGARVSVLAITFLDETYGTIVAVKHKHGVNELPLCDLKATEADTETRQLVEDYAMWFANR